MTTVPMTTSTISSAVKAVSTLHNADIESWVGHAYDTFELILTEMDEGGLAEDQAIRSLDDERWARGDKMNDLEWAVFSERVLKAILPYA